MEKKGISPASHDDCFSHAWSVVDETGASQPEKQNHPKSDVYAGSKNSGQKPEFNKHEFAF
jgi:hypothetical protein